jgi:hypothetical protein
MDQLKKLINGTKFENDFDNICEQFTEKFPNEKLEDLQHIHSIQDKHNLRITFSLDKMIMCCNLNENDVWMTVRQLILTPQECYYKGFYNDDNEEKLPTIWKEVKGVSYELYAFEQGRELTLPELGFNKDELTLCGTIDADEASIGDLLKNRRIAKSLYKSNNISYRIREAYDGQIYVIFKDGVEFAGINTHSYAYQAGDCRTNVYLYKYCGGESIIIENDGDVSSVVVISISDV